MEQERPEKKRRPLQILLLFFILLAIAALIGLGWYFLPLLLHHTAEKPDLPPISDTSGDISAIIPENPKDFAALKQQNPDIVGWISIPGTAIDYPVLRSTPEEGEDFYIDHDVNKVPKKAGAIYMQQLNSGDFSDPNTVLYGHYMKNGTMFADLHQFRKEKVFNEYDKIYIYTPGHILTYRLYSAFVYDDRLILNAFDFGNPSDYARFIEQTLHPTAMNRQVRDGVNVTTDDRIITLSTCTGVSTQRYLVMGVLIDDTITQ